MMFKFDESAQELVEYMRLPSQNQLRTRIQAIMHSGFTFNEYITSTWSTPVIC